MLEQGFKASLGTMYGMVSEGMTRGVGAMEIDIPPKDED